MRGREGSQLQSSVKVPSGSPPRKMGKRAVASGVVSLAMRTREKYRVPYVC